MSAQEFVLCLCHLLTPIYSARHSHIYTAAIASRASLSDARFKSRCRLDALPPRPHDLGGRSQSIPGKRGMRCGTDMTGWRDGCSRTSIPDGPDAGQGNGKRDLLGYPTLSGYLVFTSQRSIDQAINQCPLLGFFISFSALSIHSAATVSMSFFSSLATNSATL